MYRHHEVAPAVLGQRSPCRRGRRVQQPGLIHLAFDAPGNASCLPCTSQMGGKREGGLCGGSGRERGEVSCQASLAASPRHGQTWSPALEGRKIRDGGSAVHHRTARTMISSSKRPADPPPGSNPRSWLSCCHPVTRRQTMSTRCQHNVIRHCASARSKMRCRAPRDQLFGE